MSRFKRAISGFNASVLALSTLMTFGFTGVAHATAPQTCVWTGATSNIMNVAGNWTNCNSSVPQAGDIISFGTLTPQSGNLTNVTLTNNLGVALGGVNITETGDHNITSYAINTITFATGAVVNDTQPTIYTSVYPTSVIAQGNLSLSGKNNSGPFTGAAWQVAGVLTVKSDTSFFGNPGDTFGGFTVESGASAIYTAASTTATFSGSITLGGGTGTAGPEITFDAYCVNGSFSCNPQATNLTVSGPVTLLANASVNADTLATVSMTGSITGANYALTLDPASYGTLTINPSSNDSKTLTGLQIAQPVTNTISDSLPTTSLTVGNHVTDILDGSRGTVNVVDGGTLKGTGTVSDLYINQGGVVAPGHSPGKLTVTDLLSLGSGSTYQAELKDKAAGDFDQIVVGNPSQTTTTNPDGVVVLADTNGSSILDTQLYDGYSIKAGDQFMIINNLSSTPVSGTFDGMAEGATFDGPNGSVFKISYVGGDGNDVVLTVMTVPTTPDTGFGLVAAHPGVTLGLTVLATGAIFLISQRTRRLPVQVKAVAKRRR